MSFRIERIWAFVSVAADGDEGVIATMVGNTWMPLVAADQLRLLELRHLAQEVATSRAVEVRLVQFEARREIETIKPRRTN